MFLPSCPDASLSLGPLANAKARLRLPLAGLWWRRETVHSGNFLGQVAAFLVLTIPCSLIVSFGMAVFCAFTDRSPVGVKVLWVLLFMVTWPIGSIVYFFAVYRGLSGGRVRVAHPIRES